MEDDVTHTIERPGEVRSGRSASSDRPRSFLTPLALSACLFALSACQSAGPDAGETPGPIVIAGGQGVPLDPEEEARLNRLFEAALTEARTAADEGRTDDALAILERSLSDSPPPRYRSELIQLRREIKEVVLEEQVLVGRCETTQASYIVGEPMVVRVVFRNDSDGPVRVPFAHRDRWNDPVKGESRSLIVLRVSCQDWDWQGSTVTQERSVMIPLTEDIFIAPGREWETEVEIETDDPFFRPERVVYRRVTLSGRLQPIEILAGDLQWFSKVALAPGACELFPPGIDSVLEAPEATLTRAIELSRETPKALNHVFFGAVAMYRVDPPGAARHLVLALGEDDLGLRQTSLATLRLLSGRQDLFEVDDWRKWARGLGEGSELRDGAVPE